MTLIKSPYHYSLDLELALRELFGSESEWSHSAGSFSDVAEFRNALLKASKKIRKRLSEIVTRDDRLLLTTSLALDAIEREAKQSSEDGANNVEIIAHLIHLVAYLIGYDWLRGQSNRHIIYFQTSDQEWIDDSLRHTEVKTYSSQLKEQNKRAEIAALLYDENYRVAQIARIMLISESQVKNLLVQTGKIERKANTKNL
jgi:hypothetical protein